jgi:hypothetical protein
MKYRIACFLEGLAIDLSAACKIAEGQIDCTAFSGHAVYSGGILLALTTDL